MSFENAIELKEMLSHSSDAFLISDPEGLIIYVNPSIEKVCGLEINSHLRRNIRDLVREGLINCSATLEALEQRHTVTKRVRTVTGRWVLSTASPVNDARGRLNRVVCNIRSLTVYSSQQRNSQQGPGFAPSLLDKERPFKKISIDNGEYELVFSGQEMQEVVDLAFRLSQVDTTVLICGETGVGKELIARFIHEQSPRKKTGPFVKVNCASIPANLLEAELFGYEPGSFTGALRSGKVGFIELAHGGTLLLDEIAELPLEMQAKILGVLQDRQVYRVGSTAPKQVDLRILSATNRNLEKMVAEGKFREDLYYRLNVVPLEVPPLRSRRQDIITLLSYFTFTFCTKYNLDKHIDAEIFYTLQNYHWPGNVRELANLVERLLITIPKKKISLHHLSDQYLRSNTTLSRGSINIPEQIGPLKELVAAYESALVQKALQKCQSHSEAAEMLGISLSSLTRRIRKLKKDLRYLN